MPPEPVVDFSPLDSEGLREDQPNYRRKWSTLTNVIFKDGRLRPRPGFREPWDLRDHNMPSVSRGVPLAIVEIYNPGNTTTGRGGSPSFASEALTPNASADGSPTGWTGTFADIDEDPPDAVAHMTTSTDDSETRISFDNMANTPEHIPGVIVFARLRAAFRAQRAKFEFYWRAASVDTLVHTEIISGQYDGENEAEDWVTISFPITRDPANGTLLTKSDVDAMVIVVKYKGADSTLYEVVDPDADGNYTAWTDATAGGTAAFGDFAGQSNLPWENQTELNGIKPTANAQKQSYTLPAAFNSTFNSVSEVNFSLWGYAFPRSQLRIFYRVGGTDYTVSDFIVQGKAGTTIFQQSVSSTTNPNGGGAWTQALLESGEFGFEYLGPSTGPIPTIKGLIIRVEGLGSGASVELDWMKAYVMENDGSGNSGVLGRDQIWVTNVAMLRLDDPSLPTVTDITNSVALTEPPNAPIDWAILFGQVYVVNGDDPTRRYPNASDLFESLTTNDAPGTGALTGRTVASFADRILYGWTDDATDGITPERIAYSKRNDGGTHNDASAGTFDLISSPGGVVRLLPLSEDICVGYKEAGIYNIRQTGSDVAPLIPDLIDAFTGTSSPRTVTATLSAQGTAVHIFLGTGPIGGQNVYMYDGSSVTPIGDGIQNSLTDDFNFDAAGNAFGIADPEEGLYYLFVPEGTRQFPEAGFIYHIRQGIWTRFTLPFAVSCAGTWSIPPTPAGKTKPEAPVTNAQRRVMVGTLAGRLVTLDFGRAYDSRWPPVPATTEPALYSSDGNGTGEDRINFTSTIETGDPRPTEHPGQQITPYRLHLVHNARSLVPIDVTTSRDGGKNEETAESYLIGDLTNDDAYVHDVLDLPDVYSHRPRVKMTIVPSDTEIGWDPGFDFAEMWLEHQPQGDDA